MAQAQPTETGCEEALELEHLIGMTCDYTNSVALHPRDLNKYVYSIGPTLIVSEFSDQHNQSLLRRHSSAITCLAISECGTLMASGQLGMVNLWDFEKLRLIHSFAGLQHKAKSVLFSPDSRFLIVVDTKGLFLVWDTRSAETIFAKQLPQGLCVDAVRILSATPSASSNGKHNEYRLAVSHGFALYEWTLSYSVKRMEYVLSGEVRFHFPPNRSFNRRLTHIAHCAANGLIAATTHIGEVYVFSAKHRAFAHSFQVCSKGANVACFVDAANLIIGGGDGTVTHFRLSKNNNEWAHAKTLSLGEKASVNSLALRMSADADADAKFILATTTESKLFRIDFDFDSDAQSLAASLLFESAFSAIAQIAFGPKYNHIFATLTTDAILKLWDLSDYRSVGEVREFKVRKRGTALAFGADAQILCGFDDGSMVCYKIEKTELTMAWRMSAAHRGRVNSLKVLSERAMVLSGGDDGLLNIWSVCTGKYPQMVSQLHIQIERVLDIASDPKYAEFIHCRGSNGQIATFSLRREGVIIRRMLKEHKHRFGKLSSMAQRKHGEFELLTTTTNGFLLCWDNELAQLTRAVDVKAIIADADADADAELSISCSALSADSQYLAAGNAKGQLFVLAIDDDAHASQLRFRLVARNDVHSSAVASCAWTPDGKQIVTASIDSSVAVSNFYT